MLVKRIKMTPKVANGRLTFAVTSPEVIELSELQKDPEVIKSLIEMDLDRWHIQQSMKSTGESKHIRFK